MQISWSSSVDAAAWWTRQLPVRFTGRVESLVPAGFPAYARVFHPFETDDGQTMRWAEVAAQAGRVAHASMQHDRIATAGDAAGTIAGGPADGSLPAAELTALATLLAQHTTTPGRCWFAVWDGYGSLAGSSTIMWRGTAAPPAAPLVPTAVLNSPRVIAPGRSYLLASGPLDDVVEFSGRLSHFGSQSPNVWWPDDRAWIVATEIDLFSTYVAASDAAIGDLLASPVLEVLAGDPTDRVTFDGDDINT